MIRALYTAVSGMITQQAREEVITNNLANANTTGFKNDDLSIKKFEDVLIQNYDKQVGGKNVRNVIGSLSNGSKIGDVNTDFSQGNIESTENNTDFALEGKGFFEVQRSNGNTNNTFYTRDGHFHIDKIGNLVTNSGDKVLGNDALGNQTTINVGNGQIQCDDSGNISIDGVMKYKFKLSDFNDYNTLKKVGDNLYEGNSPIDSKASVKQNAIEKSNVNVINEMVNMMTTMRSFETNQKIVQSLDETLNKVVNEVGTVR
ncbi:MAG: flagellar hook-basal body complex protein [Solirubrobacterales bacterium]